MPLGEFDVIARYFTRTTPRSDVLLGVGDDAALLVPPPGETLVAAADTLVEARHFLPGTPAGSIGHNALAANLSDLAAMGADPAWALLSLSMPAVDEAWLEAFARGLDDLAGRHGVALVGGDTVAGPLVVTVALLGFVPPQAALRRSGAQPGDVVFVSGAPGVAAAGLDLLQRGVAPFTTDDPCVQRFLYAEPRLALGRALRGYATAAMDVSDGLLGDLGKLARASNVAASLHLDRLPIAPVLAARHDRDRCERYVLHGGDDYELLFTLPAERAESLAPLLAVQAGCGLHRIGEIAAGSGVRCLRHGRDAPVVGAGYDHFAR